MIDEYWIEERAGIPVVVEQGGSCAPAKSTDKHFWSRIKELEAENKRLREALTEVRNDGIADQEPYHFFYLAKKALVDKGGDA